MHVLILSIFYEPDCRSPGALLRRYHSLAGWAEGLRRNGLRVTVLQRFHRDEVLEQHGISYRFIADSYSPHLAKWQVPFRLHRAALAQCERNRARGDATVLHLNGFMFPFQFRHLRALIPCQHAIAAQHHAEKPMQGWRRTLQRWGMAAIDGFLFAAADLAAPWLRMGLIKRSRDVFEVMEGSTYFSPQERLSARRQTGFHGEPLFLWVGRLNHNKDPLTVLNGFAKLLEQYPQARLYMIYHTTELINQIRLRLSTSSRLQAAVSLVGEIPHEMMPVIYSSADYFVLGSHYEGSGYALVEAMACGLAPIVTDIPSFRMMTDGGRIGALWKVGDADDFAVAAGKVLQRAREDQTEQARRFFCDHLSYDAIGSQARRIYEKLSTRRSNESCQGA